MFQEFIMAAAALATEREPVVPQTGQQFRAEQKRFSVSAAPRVPDVFLDTLKPKPLSILLAETMDEAIASDRGGQNHNAFAIQGKPSTPDEGAICAIRSVAEEIATHATPLALVRLLVSRAQDQSPNPLLAKALTQLESSFDGIIGCLEANKDVAYSGKVEWDTQFGNEKYPVLTAHQYSTTRISNRAFMTSLVLMDTGVNNGVVRRVTSQIKR